MTEQVTVTPCTWAEANEDDDERINYRPPVTETLEGGGE